MTGRGAALGFAALAASALLSACTGHHQVHASGAPATGQVSRAVTASPQAEPKRVSMHLELDTTTARAGDGIHGSMVITNTTGHAIRTSCHWFQVGLQNGEVQFHPVWLLNLCSGSIPTGTTAKPITLATTYTGCLTGGTEKGVPHCTAAGAIPPLPVGSYRTVVAFETPGTTLPEPPAVIVTII